MNSNGSGKTILFFAMLAFAGMALSSWLLAPGEGAEINYGICLPSPNLWSGAGWLTPFLSWLLNALLLACSAFALLQLNRRYNMVPASDLLLPAAFLVMTGSVPWLGQGLCASTLVVLANIVCLAFLLSGYGHAYNAQNIFALASLLGLGSTFQVAFVPFIPAYFGAAFLLKEMRWREIAAFFLGLTAPYVALLGLGIVSFGSFSFELLSPIALADALTPGFMLLAIAVALTVLLTTFAALDNYLHLLKGNVETRHFNVAVFLVGLAAVAGIVINFANMTAYLATLFMVSTFQTANAYSLTRNRPRFILVLLFLCYITLYLFLANLI